VNDTPLSLEVTSPARAAGPERLRKWESEGVSFSPTRSFFFLRGALTWGTGNGSWLVDVPPHGPAVTPSLPGMGKMGRADFTDPLRSSGSGGDRFFWRALIADRVNKTVWFFLEGRLPAGAAGASFCVSAGSFVGSHPFGNAPSSRFGRTLYRSNTLQSSLTSCALNSSAQDSEAKGI